MHPDPRPVTNGGENGQGSAGFRLEAMPGVFQRISRRAEQSGELMPATGLVRLGHRNVHQMSLGEAGTSGGEAIFEEAIEEGIALFGFEDIDWTDPVFEDKDEILRTCQERGVKREEYSNQSGAVQMLDHFRNKINIGDILIGDCIFDKPKRITYI